MRGVFLSNCNEELDEVFGKTNTERSDKLIRIECFSLNQFSTNSFVGFINYDDNNDFTLGDALLFAWKKD